jgi:hypothetical protein
MRYEVFKMKKRGAIVSAIILIAGAMLVFFFYNPEKVDLYPPCPFYKLTGLKCPGCGSQRAIHNLLHLNIEQAFLYNPALLFAIPLTALLVYLEYFGGQTRFPKLHQRLSGSKFIWGIFIGIILYWIGRNL